jgi:hypothetical protein
MAYNAIENQVKVKAMKIRIQAEFQKRVMKSIAKFLLIAVAMGSGKTFCSYLQIIPLSKFMLPTPSWKYLRSN